MTASGRSQKLYYRSGFDAFCADNTGGTIGAAGLKMEVNQEQYTLVQGKNRFADIVRQKEDVTLTFTGDGTLTIRYRRGSL